MTANNWGWPWRRAAVELLVDPSARIHDDIARGTIGGWHFQLEVRRETEAGRMGEADERIDIRAFEN